MDILRTALLEMCRKRKRKFFYPDEIIQEMYPEDWRMFFRELASLINSMSENEELEIEGIQENQMMQGIIDRTFKIRCSAKPKS